MEKTKKVLRYLARMFTGFWVMSLGMGVFAGGVIAFPPLTYAIADKMLELTGVIRFLASLIPIWFLLSAVIISCLLALKGYRILDGKDEHAN